MFKINRLVFLFIISFFLLYIAGFKLCADPTLNGGKGELRILEADNEPFSPGMPLLYFSFYQGYANEKLEDTSKTSEKTVSNTFTLTFILTSKIELSTVFNGKVLPSFEKITIEEDSNEWKFKYLAYKQGALSLAVAPDFAFPIGGSEEAKTKFGGYIIASAQTKIKKKLPFKFNTNIGFFSSEEFQLPLGFSVSLSTKYSEFFIEFSSDNLSGSDAEMRLTPGIRLNAHRGLTLTFALDKTFSTSYPDKRLNILFTWLGPFSVFGAEKNE